MPGHLLFVVSWSLRGLSGTSIVHHFLASSVCSAGVHGHLTLESSMLQKYRVERFAGALPARRVVFSLALIPTRLRGVCQACSGGFS